MQNVLHVIGNSNKKQTKLKQLEKAMIVKINRRIRIKRKFNHRHKIIISHRIKNNNKKNNKSFKVKHLTILNILINKITF